MKNHQSSSLCNLCLSLITPPFLVSLVVLEGVNKGLTELGKASEEIFRGDRLPILKEKGTQDSF